MISIVSTLLTETVTLASGTFADVLTVTSAGEVAPALASATGVVIPGSAANELINHGTVTGGVGATGFFDETGPAGRGGNGGAGISLAGSGEIQTDGLVAGGAGGLGGGSEFNPGSGGNGGDGVDAATGNFYGNGSMRGGAGGVTGDSSAGIPLGTDGNGGTGVALAGSGIIGSHGAVSGGSGGSGGADGGAGGIGLTLSGSGALTNSGSISGGAGGFGEDGGPGGDGAALSGSSVLANGGSIIGGAGGGGGYRFSARPGQAGIGVSLSGTASLNNTGTIADGTGAISTYYSYAGGSGIRLTGEATGSNSGLVFGGAGAANFSSDGRASAGGAGVYVGESADFTNNKRITGGTGGAAPDGGNPGYGGAGAYISGGTFVNAGTVSGGAAGSPSGTAGDAVQFGALAGVLLVDPGAVFNGYAVASYNASDVLELSGSSTAALTGIGSEFLHFKDISFALGAHWTIAGDIGGLFAGETVSGFSPGDSIVIEGFAAHPGTFSPGPDLTLGNGTLTETIYIAEPGSPDFKVTSNGQSTTIALETVNNDGLIDIIDTLVTQSVTLANKIFAGVVTVNDQGRVSPTAAGATGVVIPSSAGNELVNEGSVIGGVGTLGGRLVIGGAGGIGIDVGNGASLSNSGLVYGGNGGSDYAGGAGGAGVYAGEGSHTMNDGRISGGTGGGVVSADLDGFFGGDGGVGVKLGKGAYFLNVGSITGGTGGYDISFNFHHRSGYGGNGGNGAYISGGTLQNAGTISGGAGGPGEPYSSVFLPGYPGAPGNAVQFGPLAGVLIVDPGAVFDGNVVANSKVADVLELAGTSSLESMSSGSEFIDFKQISFAAGAAWTFANDADDVKSGTTISGFTSSDTIILDSFASTSNSFVAGRGLILGPTETLDFIGTFDVDGAPRLDVSSDGQNTTITLGAAPVSLISTLVTQPVTPGGGTYAADLTIAPSGTIAPTAFGFDAVVSTLAGAQTENLGHVLGSAGASGGRGGAGAYGEYGTISNSGLIAGGDGANGAGSAGNGGDGVSLRDATLTSDGTITGGNGGQNSRGAGGNGAEGIFVDDSTVNLTGGTVMGGGSGNGAALAGLGVYFHSGTLITNGTIIGGDDGARAAIQFGGTGTLVVAPEAKFVGGVIAETTHTDMLELSGTSAEALAGIGTEFRNFKEIDFAAGAAWTITGNKAGLASGETISGFTASDTIVLDGFSATSKTFVTGTGLILRDGTTADTINLAGSFSTADFSISVQNGDTRIFETASGSGPAFVTRIGGPEEDTITALAADDTLNGGPGIDTLIGYAGFGDTFLGTASRLNGDTIRYFGGSDLIDITNIGTEAILSYSGSSSAGTLDVSQNGFGLIDTITFTSGTNLTALLSKVAGDGHVGIYIG